MAEEQQPNQPGSKLKGLHELVRAIFGAGVSANKLIEQRTLTHFKKLYFEDDGTPKKTKLGDQEIADLVLVNHQSLMIDELEIEFEVQMGEASEGEGEEEHLAVDTSGASQGSKASVRIKFKGGDPPEGIARINNTLVREIRDQ